MDGALTILIMAVAFEVFLFVALILERKGII